MLATRSTRPISMRFPIPQRHTRKGIPGSRCKMENSFLHLFSLPPRAVSGPDHRPETRGPTGHPIPQTPPKIQISSFRNNFLRCRFLYRALLIVSRVSRYRTRFKREIFRHVSIRCPVTRVWNRSLCDGTRCSSYILPLCHAFPSTSSFLPGIPGNDPRLPSQSSLWRAGRGNLRLRFLPGSECSCVSRCRRAVVSGAARLHVAGLVAEAE